MEWHFSRQITKINKEKWNQHRKENTNKKPYITCAIWPNGKLKRKRGGWVELELRFFSLLLYGLAQANYKESGRE